MPAITRAKNPIFKPTLVGSPSSPIESGTITIKNQSSGKLGMTAKGAFAIAASPEYSTWSASVTDGIVDFMIAGGEFNKCLVCSDKFDLGATSTSNIVLEKDVTYTATWTPGNTTYLVEYYKLHIEKQLIHVLQ